MREFFRLLIVDDEPLVRQGIVHHINWENEGFFVVGEAENGEAALQMIEELAPHLVITDVVMPVMTGEILCREIKSRFPDIEVIVLSSHGDFDYVRQSFMQGAIDYVLKPRLESFELLNALRKAKSLLINKLSSLQQVDDELVRLNIAEKILLGYDANCEQIQQMNVFPHESFTIIGFAESTHEILKNLKTQLISKNCIVYPHFRDEHFGVWVINGNSLDFLTDAIIAYAEKSAGVKFYICNQANTYTELPELYRHQMPKLTNISFYSPHLNIISAAQLSQSTHENRPFDIELMLLNFKNGEFEKGARYALDYAKSQVDKQSMASSEFKVFINNVIFNMCLEIGRQKKGLHNIQQDKEYYVQKVNSIKTAEEGVILLTEFADKALDSPKVKPLHRQDIHQIVAYIQENYTQDITLKSVAQRFYFNPSYFSSYFSNHYNEGFNEYLNRLKIKEAAYLLSTTRKNITEISVHVGYSDHSYFCKVFKKIMGATPKEYRNKEVQKA